MRSNRKPERPRLSPTAWLEIQISRPVRLDAGWLAKVDQSGGPVNVLLG